MPKDSSIKKVLVKMCIRDSNKGCYERGDSMRKNEYDKNEVYITELKTLIQREYGLSATSIVPAKRGYYGETWRVDTGGGRYFLKLDDSPEHQTKYRDSLAVVDYPVSYTHLDVYKRQQQGKAGCHIFA